MIDKIIIIVQATEIIPRSQSPSRTEKNDDNANMMSRIHNEIRTNTNILSGFR